ncbi:MAG: glycosyltransferase [Erysipelotrichaceae bacterium]|nr:glycosyltransferase [Erysipelotrichaceae bacterium]
MKKILFVNDELTTGGVTTVLFHLLNALDKEKYDISLLVLDQRVMPENIPDGIRILKTTDFFDVCDISFSECRKKGLSFLLKKILFFSLIKSGLMTSRIKAERRKMKLGHFDAEIAYKEGISTLFVLAGDAKRKLNFVHSDYKVRNYSANYMGTMKRAFKKVDVNIAVSKQARESFEELFELDNVTVIHNLLDTNRIRTLMKEPYVFPTERPVLVSVGRLHPQKSYDRLLEAVRRLNEEGFAFDLYILGDGEEKKKLLQMKEDYHLDNVTFLGNQKNPFKFMRQADLLVLSSLYEGLPTVVSEALICGTPVLSTEVAGVRELLKEDDGLIVENSEEGIYQGLKDVLKDPEKLKAMKSKVSSYQDENEDNLRKIEELL